jgi:hypothetical protein
MHAAHLSLRRCIFALCFFLPALMACPEPNVVLDGGDNGDGDGDAGSPGVDGGDGDGDGDGSCGDADALASRLAETAAAFNTLTEGVNTSPTSTVLPEDTNGTLGLGLHPSAFPIMSGSRGVFAAASELGAGRVVAFSGQDFIGSQERSTLLGQSDMDTLVLNSVYWASRTDPLNAPRVRVANASLSALLTAAEITDVTVAPVMQVDGLWSLQDWTAEALANVDVAVVQVNEWGTLHVGPDEVQALRDFVQGGGGLVIAGSALHYSWWLNYSADGFIGDLILEGTGISYNVNTQRDLSDATVIFDALSPPDALWCAYIAGDTLTDAQMARLAPIFDAAKELDRGDELDTALTRMLSETSPLPVLADNQKARLSSEVAVSLRPHTWPGTHPWAEVFPGLPEADAATADISISLDATYSGALPLGAYAPPGQMVQVKLSQADVDRGLTIRVGELYDDLRYLDHITTWNRAPMLRREFAVDDTQTTVHNPFGGSISLVVPAGETGSIIVEVTGAIPMAVHTKGVSSEDDWQTGLAGGAPQAILEEKGRVRMVVAADAAALVTNPDDVIDFWSGFHASHADLAQEPEPRMFESHWVFDIQVGWGYANATGDRITFPKLSEVWALRTQTGDEDWWLFGHELGHQFQTSNWSGGDITEVAVNLFTMYTLNDYIFEGSEFETQGFDPNTIDHAELESYVWATADLFGKLQLYRQLIFEFGWTPLRETFASYYSSDYPAGNYGEFMDGFAIRFSVMVERDLAGFFQHWGYPISSVAAETIYEFGYDPWLPPGW